MKHKSNDAVFRLTASALCLAAAYLLPFLTGQIQQIGKMLCPMHLPVLLCGMICGWQYGLAVGFIAPLLRSLIVGMPPMMPTAVAMAFELAAYGVIAGLLCRALSKKPAWIYVSLIGAMLGGRIVWGGVSYLLAGLTHRAVDECLSGLPDAVPAEVRRAHGLCGAEFAVYSGCDELTLPLLACGGAGVISTAANVVPARMHALCAKFFAGDLAGARQEQFALSELIAALFARVNPIPVKAAASLLGLCENIVRLPLIPMREDETGALRAELERLGALEC